MHGICVCASQTLSKSFQLVTVVVWSPDTKLSGVDLNYHCSMPTCTINCVYIHITFEPTQKVDFLCDFKVNIRVIVHVGRKPCKMASEHVSAISTHMFIPSNSTTIINNTWLISIVYVYQYTHNCLWRFCVYELIT